MASTRDQVSMRKHNEHSKLFHIYDQFTMAKYLKRKAVDAERKSTALERSTETETEAIRPGSFNATTTPPHQAHAVASGSSVSECKRKRIFKLNDFWKNG